MDLTLVSALFVSKTEAGRYEAGPQHEPNGHQAFITSGSTGVMMRLIMLCIMYYLLSPMYKLIDLSSINYANKLYTSCYTYQYVNKH